VAARGQASAQAPRTGPDLPVHEVTLDNGMRFLILPRPGAPTIAFVVQYAVGGVNEEPGRTGIAHLLEHMLFKGTTTIGTSDFDAERQLLELVDAVADSLARERALGRVDSSRVAALTARIGALEDSARAHVIGNEFDRILSRNGAQGLNATTTAESTIYYVELPANRAQLWFVLEADRMRNPVFREFYSERDVVMEERRMRIDTSPGGLLYEAHLGTAFQVHPYGQPVAGHMADLRRVDRAEVRAYYQRYYGPRNAVVAIVGDLDPERIESWARSYFRDLPPGEPPPPVLAVEPTQRGERRVQVEFDAEPQLRIGWHVPAPSHPDGPAIAVLATLLTGGRTARLYDALVLRDRIATFVSSAPGPGERDPQLFTIDAVPRAPHTPAEVEAAVERELGRLAETPPADAELERVRNQLAASRVRRLQSNLGLAFQLAGSTSLHGDWRETFERVERMHEVTPADVQAVVRRYFHAANRTVATLVKPPRPPEAVGGGHR
jgi:predicted Zn-dependent peptidase